MHVLVTNIAGGGFYPYSTRWNHNQAAFLFYIIPSAKPYITQPPGPRRVRYALGGPGNVDLMAGCLTAGKVGAYTGAGGR